MCMLITCTYTIQSAFSLCRIDNLIAIPAKWYKVLVWCGSVGTTQTEYILTKHDPNPNAVSKFCSQLNYMYI